MYRAIPQIVVFVLAAALSPRASTAPNLPHLPRNDPQCGFQGDSDTYGLGIRVGLYLQWVTSVIAYALVPKEAASMRGVNSCFQAAMLAGLFYITKTKGPGLYAVEAFTVLLFSIGGICASSSGPWNLLVENEWGSMGPSFGNYNETRLGALFRLMLGGLTCGYGIWFAFHGMDIMTHTPCSTFTFFFSRASLYGWFRSFLKVVTTLGMIVFTVLTVVAVVSLIISCRHWYKVGWRDDNEEDQRQDEPSYNGSRSLILLSGTGITIFIIAIELNLRWNHVYGVYAIGSTGQLLPIVISASGFLRLLHKLAMDFVFGST